MKLLPHLTHNDLRVVYRHTVLPHLPAGFHQGGEGFRMVQISDLHFYEYTDRPYYDRVIETINHDIRPDLIALTGDIIHYGDRWLPLAQEYLGRLQAPEGKFAVLGNHDYKDSADSDKVAAMLGRAGYAVLKNANLSLTRPGNDKLWLAGLDDYKHGRPDVPKALAGIPAGEAPVLMLGHNPLLFDAVANYRQTPVDFMIAGHTHGGHVYIPVLMPIYRYPLKMKYRYGFYQRRQTRLYVTSGVGSAAFYLFNKKKNVGLGLPRFRYNTWPEIVVHTLVPQAPAEVSATRPARLD